MVARAQLGDLRALDRVLATIQDPLFRHVRLILGDDHEAEDAMQEILLTISRKLGSLRDVQWFRAWAYRIATREAVRHAQRLKRMPMSLDADALDNIPAREDVRFDVDILEELPAMITSLSPASQLVVRMHYLEGMTHSEVAEALELSLGTVKSRLAYGLGLLRTRLQTRT
ncbi:MAG: RNA polymerase sigma factor [Gemmatimonadaceae bacterium]